MSSGPMHHLFITIFRSRVTPSMRTATQDLTASKVAAGREVGWLRLLLRRRSAWLRSQVLGCDGRSLRWLALAPTWKVESSKVLAMSGYLLLVLVVLLLRPVRPTVAAPGSSS